MKHAERCHPSLLHLHHRQPQVAITVTMALVLSTLHSLTNGPGQRLRRTLVIVYASCDPETSRTPARSRSSHGSIEMAVAGSRSLHTWCLFVTAVPLNVKLRRMKGGEKKKREREMQRLITLRNDSFLRPLASEK